MRRGFLSNPYLLIFQGNNLVGISTGHPLFRESVAVAS